MNKTVILGAAFAASSMLWGADTKIVKSRNAACQVSVPADWETSELGGIADSADRKLSVAVSSPKMVGSFSELKQTAHSIYKESRVTKDSAAEFEMEGKSMTGKPNIYRAIPVAGGKFCIAEVMYRGGTPDEARKIAESLASGK